MTTFIDPRQSTVDQFTHKQDEIGALKLLRPNTSRADLQAAGAQLRTGTVSDTSCKNRVVSNSEAVYGQE